jgi:hypothetical protein
MQQGWMTRCDASRVVIGGDLLGIVWYRLPPHGEQ